VLASHEIVQSYYWDTPAHSDEILASYFPLAQRAVQEVLEEAGTSLEELKWIVPHNVSRRSWEILAEILGVDPAKIWLSNVPRVGHTVSSDHVINLCDMESRGALESGDRLLLFTFGFGAAWSAAVIEH
jgi:3-oxoacyl-[acyl-carrier-protein] synthase-3